MKLLSTSFKLILSVLVALPVTLAVPATTLASPYANTKVLRIPTGASAESLADLQGLIDTMGLHSWTAVPQVSSHVDLEVPAGKYARFLASVNKIIEGSGAGAAGYKVEVMHEDLGASIIAESEGSDEPVILPFGTSAAFGRSPLYSRMSLVGLANDAWFNAYHPYADHLTFLNDLVATFPNNAKIVTSGTSVGGRAITGINIFGSGGSGNRPAVVWHGTVRFIVSKSRSSSLKPPLLGSCAGVDLICTSFNISNVTALNKPFADDD